MSRGREKMRPWLVRQINSNTVSGLCWIDQEKTMFSVPWKHAARQGWDMDTDACIFQRWAVHTGKYAVGQKCNPKTWKANFRCALNSLPDVEEVKQRSVHRGHGARRVFRLLPEFHRPRGRRTTPRKTKLRRKMKIEESDSHDEESSYSPLPHSPLQQVPSQESTVDSTMDQQADVKVELEVPDWSQTVEVGYTFQVSPEHSPDSSDCVVNNLTIMICQPQDTDKHDLCTSPGSQWSETSSGEETEEQPLFTTLSPPLPAETWSSSLPQILFDFPDDGPFL